MKNRLPRKRKKEVKKVVAASNAKKTVLSALTMMQSAFQVAAISAQPTPLNGDRNSHITDKALKVSEVTLNASETLANIQNEFS